MHFYMYIGILLLHIEFGIVLARHSVTFRKRETVELYCPYNNPTWFGPPSRNIYAVGDDILKFYQNKISVTNEAEHSSLIIRNFSNENEGYYYCDAGNGNQQYFVTLQDEVRPTTLAIEINTNTVEGQNGDVTDGLNLNRLSTNDKQHITDKPQSAFEIYVGCSTAAWIIVIFLVVIFMSRKRCCEGVHAGHSRSIHLQRRELQPQNETGEEIGQYDEIDIIYSSAIESITTEQISEHSDTRIRTPITNLEINVDTPQTCQLDICLSEVDRQFNRQISATSSSSSECSYLNPSGPYMELQQIQNRPKSLHEYEHIADPEIKTCLIKLSESCLSKHCGKRSTI